MPDETLEDLLRACLVWAFSPDAADPSIGFFVGPRTVLTQEEFQPPRPPMEGQKAYRYRAIGTLQGDGAKVIRSTEIHNIPILRDDPSIPYTIGLLALVVEDFGEHPWAHLELEPPRKGDGIVVAGPQVTVFGRYVGTGGLETMPLADLDFDTDQIGAAIVGGPVLNLRTGGVWGIVRRSRRPPDFEPRVLPMGLIPGPIAENVLDRREPAMQRRWARALGHPEPAVFDAESDAGLLFRLYIPSGRLYAAETARLVNLFRDWLMATNGYAVRQTSQHTALGQLIEFFAADHSVATPNIQEQVDRFSSFVTLCRDDPEAAITVLEDHLDRPASEEIVHRFRKEYGRLELDMRQQRERRMLSLKQSLESDLLEQGLELETLPQGQIAELVNKAVPGPGAAVRLALMVGQWAQHVTVNLNQQIIDRAVGVIAQNVEGDVNLGPEATELMELIDRYGGSALELRSAVHTFEDPDIPKRIRSAAKRGLKQFLSQLGEVTKGLTTDLLTKYLESKGL